MQDIIAPQKSAQKPKTKAKPQPKSEPIIKLSSDKPSKLRALLSFFLAGLAMLFAISTIFSFWVERTLTDTDRFTSIVGSLAKEEAVKNFISEEVTKAVVEQGSQSELASELLNTPAGAAISPVIKAELEQKVSSSVDRVVSSKAFEDLWQNGAESLHTQAISLLEGEGDSVTVINLGPQIKSVVKLVDETELKIDGDFKLEGDVGQIQIKSEQLAQARQVYRQFTSADTAALILALVFGGLAVLTANNRLKMVRRLAFGLAVISASIILVVMVSGNISLGSDNQTQAELVKALTSNLLGGLKNIALVILGVSLATIIASSLAIRQKSKESL